MKPLFLHDTATRTKRAFVPQDPARVTMYVCGPTVYARAHIGNARPAVVFDVLFRLLRHRYGANAVHYVRNITDIDDKILVSAAESGRAIGDVTSEAIDWYHEDLAALGTLEPTAEPRATDYVDGMIAMVRTLLRNGVAYEAKRHVLFDITKDAAYGTLSKRSQAKMIAGARVEVAPYKRNRTDFVLWKPSSPDQPGWDSPWGRGRPGWHLECSVMSRALLGESIDIHGGGIDLVFPHHENECAQCRGVAPEAPFARYWIHNGHLRLDGRKMAKSKGNIRILGPLLEAVPGEVVRLALLSAQYRQPLDWTTQALEDARNALAAWRRVAESATPDPEPPAGVMKALADDLNTPRAITELHRLAKAGDAGALAAGGAMLGLLGPELGAWSQPAVLEPEIVARIEALVAARTGARAAGSWDRADEIRDWLNAAGVEVTDEEQGSRWRAGPAFRAALLPREAF